MGNSMTLTQADFDALQDERDLERAAYEARIANLEADKNHLRLERNAERATCRRLLAEVARVKTESLRVVVDGKQDCVYCGGTDIECIHCYGYGKPVRLERWEEQG